MERPKIQHWLVTVTREAGLPNAETLDIGGDVDLEAAWDAISSTTGASAEELTSLVARHYSLEVADLDARDPYASRLIPAALARKFGVVALECSDRTIRVATADPVTMNAEADIHRTAARTVYFSIAPPGALRDAIRDDYADVNEPEATPAAPAARGGPRILVVDDDANMRLLLRTVLEEADFGVDEAENGEQALEMVARGFPYDLVTLDLQMEGLHGLDVLRKLRSRLATATLPVVVATGSGDPATEMELFDAGADDFVVKPVDPPRFLLRVQAVLRRRSSNPLADLF